jgi:Uma2 family endonuclease
LSIVLNEWQVLGILTEAGAESAPDFVIEILSPKTRRLDLVNKKQGMLVPESKNSGSSTLNLAPS